MRAGVDVHARALVGGAVEVQYAGEGRADLAAGEVSPDRSIARRFVVQDVPVAAGELEAGVARARRVPIRTIQRGYA
jgi:hypothetical protein